MPSGRIISWGYAAFSESFQVCLRLILKRMGLTSLQRVAHTHFHQPLVWDWKENPEIRRSKRTGKKYHDGHICVRFFSTRLELAAAVRLKNVYDTEKVILVTSEQKVLPFDLRPELNTPNFDILTFVDWLIFRSFLGKVNATKHRSLTGFLANSQLSCLISRWTVMRAKKNSFRCRCSELHTLPSTFSTKVKVSSYFYLNS